MASKNSVVRYTSYIELNELILKQSQKFNRYVLFGIFIFVIGLLYMYSINGFKMDVKILFCMIIFLLTMVFIQYNQIMPHSEVISNTAVEIEFYHDEIRVRTTAFNVFLWFSQKERWMKFDAEKTKILITSFPAKDLYDLDNSAIKIVSENQGVYILTDFFENDLENQLISFRN